MKKLLAGILGFGLWCGPALWSAQPDRPEKNHRTPQPMSEDMRQAIAFEHAKDVADARQARLEARQPSVPVPGAQHSANRAEEESTSGRPVIDPGPGHIKH